MIEKESVDRQLQNIYGEKDRDASVDCSVEGRVRFRWFHSNLAVTKGDEKLRWDIDLLPTSRYRSLCDGIF